MTRNAKLQLFVLGTDWTDAGIWESWGHFQPTQSAIRTEAELRGGWGIRQSKKRFAGCRR
jgi:hypothetical protein